LGITNGYKVFLLAQSAKFEDVMDDYESMSRSQFNIQYGLAVLKDKHECPECGATHTVKGEGDGA
jgi:hypothetical protein